MKSKILYLHKLYLLSEMHIKQYQTFNRNISCFQFGYFTFRRFHFWGRHIKMTEQTLMRFFLLYLISNHTYIKHSVCFSCIMNVSVLSHFMHFRALEMSTSLSMTKCIFLPLLLLLPGKLTIARNAHFKGESKRI